MQININLIQYYAIVGSILLFFFIIYLVRNRKISEQYSLIWIFLSIIFIIFSFWRDGLNYLSSSIGIVYPPVAFLLILIMAIFLILIHFSVVITKLSKQNKKLTQELSMITFELDNMKNILKINND